MNILELQEQARKILEIKVNTDETNTFLVKSGGRPIDEVGVKEFILRQTSDVKYKTQFCGTAYESETLVKCTDTKTKDNQGFPIYLLPNGETFVWDYSCGNAHNFDRGCFAHPEMK